MSRPIAPGQTVPVPFTLSETPDWDPSYQLFVSPPNSALTAAGFGTATVVSGRNYQAEYDVPINAANGTAYLLLVTVTIAGETTTHWLDGGTVQLWASQASVDNLAVAVGDLNTDFDGVDDKLDLIMAKTNLLKAGLNVQFPFVSATGTIVLFEGFDFTDSGNAAIKVTEAEAGQFDTTRIAIGTFQFYMRSQTSGDDYLGIATVSQSDGLYTLKAEIVSEDLPTKIGMYDWWFMATEVGTGTGTAEEDNFGIVHGTLELRRGMKLTC